MGKPATRNRGHAKEKNRHFYKNSQVREGKEDNNSEGSAGGGSTATRKKQQKGKRDREEDHLGTKDGTFQKTKSIRYIKKKEGGGYNLGEREEEIVFSTQGGIVGVGGVRSVRVRGFKGKGMCDGGERPYVKRAGKGERRGKLLKK